jgi:hypothetical protein
MKVHLNVHVLAFTSHYPIFWHFDTILSWFKSLYLSLINDHLIKHLLFEGELMHRSYTWPKCVNSNVIILTLVTLNEDLLDHVLENMCGIPYDSCLMHALSMLGPMTQSPPNRVGLRRSADTDRCRIPYD